MMGVAEKSSKGPLLASKVGVASAGATSGASDRSVVASAASLLASASPKPWPVFAHAAKVARYNNTKAIALEASTDRTDANACMVSELRGQRRWWLAVEPERSLNSFLTQRLANRVRGSLPAD